MRCTHVSMSCSRTTRDPRTSLEKQLRGTGRCNRLPGRIRPDTVFLQGACPEVAESVHLLLDHLPAHASTGGGSSVPDHVSLRGAGRHLARHDPGLFPVWMLRVFFASLPLDLEESALIEGASRLKAFRLIVLPLAVPGLVATFLFCMMFAWNDYLFALMLTFSRASTLPMYIAGEGTQSYGPQWWYLSALSLMAVVPMAVVAVLTR